MTNESNQDLTRSSQQKLTKYSSDLIKKGLNLANRLNYLDLSEKTNINLQAQDWQCFSLLNGTIDNITSICISSNEEMIAVADAWGSLYIWSLLDKQLLYTLDCGYQKKPDSEILKEFYSHYQKYGGSYTAFITHDNNYIISFSKERLSMWDLSNGQLIQEIPLENLSLVDSKKLICLTFQDLFGQLLLGEIDTGELIGEINTELTHLTGFSIHQDLPICAIAGYNFIHSDNIDDNKLENDQYTMRYLLQMWDFSNQTLLYTLIDNVLEPDRYDAYLSTIINTKLEILLTVDNFLEEDFFVVKIWDLKSKKINYTLSEKLEEATIKIILDEILVTHTKDNILQVWNLKNGNLLHSLVHEDCVFDFDIDQNGNFLVSSCSDGKLIVWNLKKGIITKSFSNNSTPINWILFNKNGLSFIGKDYENNVNIWKISEENNESQNEAKNKYLLSLVRVSKDIVLQGQQRYQSGDYDGALESYTKAIKFDPTNASEYNSRSTLFSTLGDYPEAIKDLQTARQLSQQ